MRATIEIPEPPDGGEIIGPGPAQSGDMYLTAQGWMMATPGYFQAIRARRKKKGLVEMLDDFWDMDPEFSGYTDALKGIRARLAAIEREPTDEECLNWWEHHAPERGDVLKIRAAIKAAREVGQGGDK